MKKFISMLLCGLLVLGLAGCQKDDYGIEIEIVKSAILQRTKNHLEIMEDINPEDVKITYGKYTITPSTEIEGLYAIEGDCIVWIKEKQRVSTLDVGVIPAKDKSEKTQIHWCNIEPKE